MRARAAYSLTVEARERSEHICSSCHIYVAVATYVVDGSIWTLPAHRYPFVHIAPPFIHTCVWRRYVQERSSLMPYIYSAVRKMHSELLSLIRPMYHDFSEEEGAFDAATPDGGMAQYMFGNDMFVAPVVSKADEETLLAAKKVWMPPGQWVELEGGQIWEGAGVVEMQVGHTSARRAQAAPLFTPTFKSHSHHSLGRSRRGASVRSLRGGDCSQGRG